MGQFFEVLGGQNIGELIQIFVGQIFGELLTSAKFGQGLIARKKALAISTAFFFVGVVLSVFLNPWAMSIAIINACLLIVCARYSKTMLFTANVLIAGMTASVFIFSGAILKRIDLNVIVLASVIVLLAFLAGSF